MTTVAAAASVAGLISISVLGVKSLVSLVESVKKVVQAPEVHSKYVRELHSLERILQQLQHLGSSTARITDAQAKQIEALALDTTDFVAEIQASTTEFRDAGKWAARFRETRLSECRDALSSRHKRLSLQIDALTLDVNLEQTVRIGDIQSTLDLLSSKTREREETIHTLDLKTNSVLSSLDKLQDNFNSWMDSKDGFIPTFRSPTDQILTGSTAVHVEATSQIQGLRNTNRHLEHLITTASVHSKTLTEVKNLLVQQQHSGQIDSNSNSMRTHLSAPPSSIFSERQYISNASQTEPLSLAQIDCSKASLRSGTLPFPETQQQSVHPLVRDLYHMIHAREQQQRYIERLEQKRLQMLDNYDLQTLYDLVRVAPWQYLQHDLDQEFAEAHEELSRLKAQIFSLSTDCTRDGLILGALKDTADRDMAARPKPWLLQILGKRDQSEGPLPLLSATDYCDDNVMMKDLICNFSDTHDRIDRWLLYSNLCSPLNKILHQGCVTDAVGEEHHSDPLEDKSAELAAWAHCLLATWLHEPLLSQHLKTAPTTVSSYSSAAAVWSAESEFLCSRSV